LTAVSGPTGDAERGTRARLARAARLATGLADLATSGRAAVGTPRPSSDRRRYATARLPAASVRAVSRELGTSTSALLLGVLGEALHRHGAPVTTSNGRIRTAVPLTARRVRRSLPGAPASGRDVPGNDTAAIMLDLPIGPMPARARIAEVARALDLGDAQSVASRFAVMALGRLPGALQTRLARLVYGGRFFSVIASVMPGWRRELRVLGARVTSVYPVLPLADGVGLAVGYLSWGDVLGIGVTADSALFPDPDRFVDTLVEVFGDVASGAQAGHSSEVVGHA
jgi:hypothetical protein